MIPTFPTRRRRWTVPMSNTAPLSRKQKGIVCSVARRAFLAMRAAGALDPATEETTWRHEQQEKAVGRYSLRSAIQDDYKPLMAHFLNLLGDVKTALRYQTEAVLEPRKLAMAQLRAMCGKRGVTMDYADGICQQAWKCSLADANEQQVWWVRRKVQKMPKPVAESSQLSVASCEPESFPPPDDTWPDGNPF